MGKVVINEEGSIVQYSSRNTILEQLNKYLNIWSDRVEQVIIKASSNNLAFSPTIQHFLNPVRRIISTILLTGEISNKDLNAFPKTDRALEWIYLLQNLEIIKQTEYGYKYGDMWSMLYDSTSSLEKKLKERYYQLDTILHTYNRASLFQYLIMSYLLEENYGYIKDVMNLKGISRILNVNTCYYKPCLEAQKLLQFKPKTILFNYTREYGKLKFPLISSAIMELITVGLLEYKKGLLYGSEPHFEQMLNLEPSRQISLSIY